MLETPLVNFNRWAEITPNNIDGLELSIISTAPFAVGLLDRKLDYLKVQKCSFWGNFLRDDQIETIRNSLNLWVCSPAEDCPGTSFPAGIILEPKCKGNS